MKNILILGHKGLLGNMVYKYFSSVSKKNYLHIESTCCGPDDIKIKSETPSYKILTTDLRWNTEEFKDFVKNSDAHCIINCIGIIPQRKPEEKLYNLINYELPVWLDSLGIKIIHPDTDEPDDTPYGFAKKLAREEIGKNTKILKTSIMGFEEGTKFSFLEWFLNSKESISGFTNQFWNGNTTLEWAKWAEDMMLNWDSFKKVTILSNPDCLSKYEILLKLKMFFNKDIEIIPTESLTTKNNCLTGDYTTKNLTNQIIEMKYFYENQK